MQKNRKTALIMFILGVADALIAAFIMFHGHVFEENNSGIATVIGIIGIGLIASSGYRLLSGNK
jgi:hypothetical protein